MALTREERFLSPEDRYLADPGAPVGPTDDELLAANMGGVQSQVLAEPAIDLTPEQEERSELVGKVLDYADMKPAELSGKYREKVNEYTTHLSKLSRRGVAFPAAHPDSEKYERDIDALKRALESWGYQPGGAGSRLT
mgnify:CR=1 FL=1